MTDLVDRIRDENPAAHAEADGLESLGGIPAPLPGRTLIHRFQYHRHHVEIYLRAQYETYGYEYLVTGHDDWTQRGGGRTQSSAASNAMAAIDGRWAEEREGQAAWALAQAVPFGCETDR